MSYMFRTSQFTVLPTIDCRACSAPTYLFANMPYLTTIEKWILPTTSSQNFSSAFLQDEALTDINEIEGTIKSSISFSDSPLLSAKSLINIIKHLVQNPNASASERKILSIHPTAFERLGLWGSPWDAGIDFDGGWSWYLESIGWDI